MADKHKVFKTPQQKFEERAREGRRDASGLADEDEGQHIMLPPEDDDDAVPTRTTKYVPKKGKKVKWQDD